MSGWKIVTRALHDAGGGPLHVSAFDTAELAYDGFWHGIHRARELGLIENTVSGWGCADKGRWALTPIGVDWCAGRVVAEYQTTKRLKVVATWLKALPYANDIRLGTHGEANRA